MADEYEETIPGVDPDPAPPEQDETEPIVEEAAPAPDQPPVIEEPPQESAQATAAREAAALRQYVTLLEQQVRQGQAAPAPPPPQPDFWSHMTPEQKQAWNASYKELEPVLQYRERQLMAQMEGRVRAIDTRAEVADLRGEFGDDFRAKEPQLVQMREQIYRQGGGWLPLADLYLHQVGQEAIQAKRTQRNATTQQRRRPAAQAARPANVAPAGVRTAPPNSVLSDEEFMDKIARESGIPRLKVAKRAS